MSIRKKILTHAALITFGIIFAAPFIWMVSTSLKPLSEINQITPTLIPKDFRWNNYIRVFEEIPYLQYTFNTFYVSLLNVVGQLLTVPMIAYSLSKIHWKGSKIIFPIIIATMLLPFQVTLIPLYLIFQKLHMTGTYWPLIIPAFLAASGSASALYIFLLRQFFKTIPDALIHAAKIDGASEFMIYWRIMLPLCRPALATIAIFTFLYTWSDFLGPLIYINKQEMYTLTLGLQAFLSEYYVEWDLLMAASVMFTFPVIVLFFFAQKQFIEGITVTGIKG